MDNAAIWISMRVQLVNKLLRDLKEVKMIRGQTVLGFCYVNGNTDVKVSFFFVGVSQEMSSDISCIQYIMPECQMFLVC